MARPVRRRLTLWTISDFAAGPDFALVLLRRPSHLDTHWYSSLPN
jgi:hypothetical protein